MAGNIRLSKNSCMLEAQGNLCIRGNRMLNHAYRGLTIEAKGKNKCSSYKGKITSAEPNVLKQDFHAEAQNQKWLTDIMEFTFFVLE